MGVRLRVIGLEEIPVVARLIEASVRGLQVADYDAAQREAALATVFTVDTRLVADGGYFGAYGEAGELVGCGGWSARKTLYGGDAQVEAVEADWLDPAVDAAKIRAIFVHPGRARQGIGGMLLRAAEDAARAAGFRRFEMGSTLTGVALYARSGYREVERRAVPVGSGQTIEVVRMVKEG
jgi:GNAT superfamily N-acetyltransferase